MKVPSSGGGWQAIAYTLRTARMVGIVILWRAMRTKNTCKTSALGMGGQQGGMRNEKGHFPEFCKKSLQAMAADMQGKIEERFFERYSIAQMQGFSRGAPPAAREPRCVVGALNVSILRRSLRERCPALPSE